jgi:hypothetical protein
MAIEMYLCEPENGEMIPDCYAMLELCNAIELRYNEKITTANHT